MSWSCSGVGLGVRVGLGVGLGVVFGLLFYVKNPVLGLVENHHSNFHHPPRSLLPVIRKMRTTQACQHSLTPIPESAKLPGIFWQLFWRFNRKRGAKLPG